MYRNNFLCFLPCSLGCFSLLFAQKGKDRDGEQIGQKFSVQSFSAPAWSNGRPSLVLWGRKKPIDKKHRNVFLTALGRQSSQGRTPTCPRDKGDKNGDFTVELKLNRERPVCPRDGCRFAPGTGPVCDGLCLSQGQFLFVMNTVPPKVFMLIGFFLARVFPVSRGTWPKLLNLAVRPNDPHICTRYPRS